MTFGVVMYYTWYTNQRETLTPLITCAQLIVMTSCVTSVRRFLLFKTRFYSYFCNSFPLNEWKMEKCIWVIQLLNMIHQSMWKIQKGEQDPQPLWFCDLFGRRQAPAALQRSSKTGRNTRTKANSASLIIQRSKCWPLSWLPPFQRFCVSIFWAVFTRLLWEYPLFCNDVFCLSNLKFFYVKITSGTRSFLSIPV